MGSTISQSFDVTEDMLEGWMADDRPEFALNLEKYFGFGPSREVLNTLEKLQIPLPQRKEQYVCGTDGILIFSNEHAVVVRIELQDELSVRNQAIVNRKCKGAAKDMKRIRIDDSPWVLQPLGSISGSGYKIEIMPGVNFESDPARNRRVYRGMLAEGNHYWDSRVDNIGRLPFLTPEFPEGVPVVIDRMAAEKLSKGIEPVKTALFEMKCRLQKSGYSASAIFMRSAILRQKLADYFYASVFPGRQSFNLDYDPQQILYGALKRIFREAWPEGKKSPDPDKVKKFWEKVKEAKQENRLVAGWNEALQPDKNNQGKKSKTTVAAMAAAAYQNRNSAPDEEPSCLTKNDPSSGAQKFLRRSGDRPG